MGQQFVLTSINYIFLYYMLLTFQLLVYTRHIPVELFLEKYGIPCPRTCVTVSVSQYWCFLVTHVCLLCAYSHLRTREVRTPEKSSRPKNKACNCFLRGFKNHRTFQKGLTEAYKPNNFNSTTFEPTNLIYYKLRILSPVRCENGSGIDGSWQTASIGVCGLGQMHQNAHFVELPVCHLCDVPVLPRCLSMPFMQL